MTYTEPTPVNNTQTLEAPSDRPSSAVDQTYAIYEELALSLDRQSGRANEPNKPSFHDAFLTLRDTAVEIEPKRAEHLYGAITPVGRHMAVLQKLNLFDSEPDTPERALNNAAVAYSKAFRIEDYTRSYVRNNHGQDSSVSVSFGKEIDPFKRMSAKMQILAGRTRVSVQEMFAASDYFRTKSLIHIKELEEMLSSEGVEVDHVQTSQHMQAFLFASTAELTPAQRNNYKILLGQATKAILSQDFAASTEAMINIALELPEVASRSMMGILGINPDDIDTLIEYRNTEKGVVTAQQVVANALRRQADKRDLRDLHANSETALLAWLEKHPEIINTTFRIVDITCESNGQGYVHFGETGKTKAGLTGLKRSVVTVDQEGIKTIMPSKGVLSLAVLKTLYEAGAIIPLDDSAITDTTKQELPDNLWSDYIALAKRIHEDNLHDTEIVTTADELAGRLTALHTNRAKTKQI